MAALGLALVLAVGSCASPPPPVVEIKPKTFGTGVALWRAVQFCSPVEVEELLEAGAKPDYRFGPQLSTPLMQAVGSFDSKCPKRIAQILIQAGAGPNTRDKRGWTPLHYIADSHCIPSHIEALEYLLQRGADPTILNKAKQTPLDLATANYCALAKGMLADHLRLLRLLRLKAERAPWLPPAPPGSKEAEEEAAISGDKKAEEEVDESNLPWMKNAPENQAGSQMGQ